MKTRKREMRKELRLMLRKKLGIYQRNIVLENPVESDTNIANL